ncbi:MAG: hypothetical protein WBI47_02675 [Atribacterales bacterium]
MPEILYQASMLLFLLWFLKTMDPGLKIAGVTNKGNKYIQEQAKNGSKIAGVTRRWESKGFCP